MKNIVFLVAILVIASNLVAFTGWQQGIRASTQPPSPVTLVTPNDNQTEEFITTAFSWITTFDGGVPTEYRLEVSTDQAFTAIVINVNTPNTFILPSTPLALGTQYWWRVIAINSYGESTNNAINTFTTTGWFTGVHTGTQGLRFERIGATDAVRVSRGTANAANHAGHIIIPETVLLDSETLTVTEIAQWAFLNHTALTNITIPETVTHISSQAFDRTSLTGNTVIPNSVESFGNGAFTRITSPFTITLPTNPAFTTISQGLFEWSPGLTEITIPNSVTHIQHLAFWNTRLVHVVIPNSVSEIQSRAFDGAEEIVDRTLRSIIIPSSVITMDINVIRNAHPDLVIYAESASRPATWHDEFNFENALIIWDILSRKPIDLMLAGTQLSWSNPDMTDIRESDRNTVFKGFRVYKDGAAFSGILPFTQTTYNTSGDGSYTVKTVFTTGNASEPSNTVVYCGDCGDCEECEDEDPLFVTMSTFSVSVAGANAVSVNWTTASESGIRGFHVLRSLTSTLSGGEGDFNDAIRITHNLIPATNTSILSEYRFLDDTVIRGREYHYWVQAIANDMTIKMHGPISAFIETDEIVQDLPLFTTMRNVFPNPVRGDANFGIKVKEGETANLRIYNLRGQLVREFTNIRAGENNIIWNSIDSQGREVSTGVYFYKLTSPSNDIVRRMVVVK